LSEIPDGIFPIIKELAFNPDYRRSGFIFSLLTMLLCGYLWFILDNMSVIIFIVQCIGLFAALMVIWYLSLLISDFSGWLGGAIKRDWLYRNRKLFRPRQQTEHIKTPLSGEGASILRRLEAQRRQSPANPSVYLSDDDFAVRALYEGGYIKRDADKPEKVFGASDYRHAYFITKEADSGHR